jgi:hypothetical protein
VYVYAIMKGKALRALERGRGSRWMLNCIVFKSIDYDEFNSF